MRTWLSEARKKKNLTARALAEKVGVSESYYSMIESGQRQKTLDITIATKLASALDLSLEYVVKEESCP